MKIEQHMNLKELSFAMGGATEAEAELMRELLYERGYEGDDVLGVDEETWAVLLDEAVEGAK